MSGGAEGRELHIHYRRPPDREQVYEQRLLVDRPEVKISYAPRTPLNTAMEVGGRPVLEPGSPVVWFTFAHTWHDIGRFHLADGTFTGIYANVLTPVELHGSEDEPLIWRTTDLFLDVWVGTDGRVSVLDEPELEQAESRGWVEPAVARRARREAAELRQRALDGTWPPPVVRDWTLERVLAQSSATTQAPERRSTST